MASTALNPFCLQPPAVAVAARAEQLEHGAGAEPARGEQAEGGAEQGGGERERGPCDGAEQHAGDGRRHVAGEEGEPECAAGQHEHGRTRESGVVDPELRLARADPGKGDEREGGPDRQRERGEARHRATAIGVMTHVTHTTVIGNWLHGPVWKPVRPA